MAAQRAMSETARAWHAKLAQDFAERANACSGTGIGIGIGIGAATQAAVAG